MSHSSNERLMDYAVGDELAVKHITFFRVNKEVYLTADIQKCVFDRRFD